MRIDHRINGGDISMRIDRIKGHLKREPLTLLADVENHCFGRIARRVESAYKDYPLRVAYRCKKQSGKRGIVFWYRERGAVENKKLSAVCLYDEIFWNDSDISKLASEYACILCCNKSIAQKVRNNRAVKMNKTPVFEIHDGVDDKLFSPPQTRSNARLQIGWAGIPTWRGESDKDPKGYKILQEAAKLTSDMADWHFAENNVPFDKMPEWYRKLDIVICASIAEGTPNPVLEGMASGCLILSTPVGIVPELIKDGAKIIQIERNAQSIAEAIKGVSQKTLLDAIKTNPAVIRRKWSWSKALVQWRPVLEFLERVYDNASDCSAPG